MLGWPFLLIMVSFRSLVTLGAETERLTFILSTWWFHEWFLQLYSWGATVTFFSSSVVWTPKWLGDAQELAHVLLCTVRLDGGMHTI